MKTIVDVSILKQYQSTGTRAGGVKESLTIVDKYLNRVRTIVSNFKGHSLPACVLAAIALRESRCGAMLDDNGYGDRGHAYGICQIDERYHITIGSPDSVEHIAQCDDILIGFFLEIKKKHNSWPEERQLQGAIAAYNVGVANIKTIEGIDIGTTHDDYSNDVWAMANYLTGLI